MASSTAGSWKSKLLVASVVGLICGAIYPVVIVPLQIAYGGAERPERDPSLRPGFQKKGMWSNIETASKQGASAADNQDHQQPQQ